MGDARLDPAELAMLDALITYAQQRGMNFDEVLDEPDCENHDGAAETVEARHDGIWRLFAEHHRAISGRLANLSRDLGDQPTLGQLLELRGRAVRIQPSRER